MLRVTFSPQEIEQLRHEFLHHPHPRVRLKMQVVLLKSQELRHHQIAAIAGVHPRTVRRYLEEFQEGGVDRLKELRFHQPHSELDRHAIELENYFVEHPPRSAREAQAAIQRLTGLRRSQTQIRKFLKRRGLRRLKTGPACANADPQAQKAFLDRKLRPRLNQAKRGRRVVYFVDASHHQYGAVMGYIWSWVRRYVPSPASRKRVNVLGALNPLSLELETIGGGENINNLTVRQLLQRLRERHPQGPLTVFLDRVRYQYCAAVFAEAKRLKIDLQFLPTGSPNLNLIERLWKWLRGDPLSTRTFATFQDFCKTIRDSLEEVFLDEKENLRSLFALNFQIIDPIYLLVA